MTTNNPNEPIDPDQIELDDVFLDLAGQDLDPTMMDAILKDKRTTDTVGKYAKEIDKIVKNRKKK